MAIHKTKYETKNGKIRKVKNGKSGTSSANQGFEASRGAAEITSDADKNKKAGLSNGNSGIQGA